MRRRQYKRGPISQVPGSEPRSPAVAYGAKSGFLEVDISKVVFRSLRGRQRMLFERFLSVGFGIFRGPLSRSHKEDANGVSFALIWVDFSYETLVFHSLF